MAQRTEAYIIRCQGVNLNSGFAEGPNKFTILMEADFDVTQLQVGFEGPSTPEVRLVTRKNKNVDVTFIPEVGGEYQIHIKYKGDHVFSSPFACKILGSVRSKLGKIICSGDTQRGRVGVKNFIVIDGRQLSVNGGFVAGMVGPSQAELEFVRNEDGTVLFTFLVTEEGEYKLNLKFLHYQLPGSPFLIMCSK